MNEKLPISVHILTFNSAKTLERTLKSVTNCAEILLIDGGSTDGTLEIASRFGCVVVPQGTAEEQGKPVIDFSIARNQGLKYAKQPWILSVDSDEYISSELQQELSDVIASQPEPAAYLLPRRYVLENGTVVMHATTYPNERLYFFHRDVVSRWIKPVHERPELKPDTPIKRLKGASLAPIGTIEEYKEKNLRYLAIEAERDRGKGWMHWFRHRLLHTIRSRLIGLVRLLWIWLLPHGGKRLPLKHELMRFWYGWKLIVSTIPGR